MILLDLKRYIKTHDRVTFSDIKNHFDLTDDAASALLLPLIKQGHIQEIGADGCSSGLCSTGCVQTSLGASYQWIDKPLKNLSIPVQIL
ncbi:FeoC-like transcriptional regulator [Thiomicrorhabdus sp.]|uniref:FeoC-like transcriptional regulator n=1 Tax=Thiomicrorhabdus sp. TaxID=2039724 RepID=UPI0029C78417|nr:FeoC-like transcriptional regulator [Thiomicrorhabdus sp.]